MKSKCCNDRPGDNTDACGSEKAEGAQQDSAGERSSDCSRMMAMMAKCCPEKTKDFSSMMADIMGRCHPSEEERGFEASPATKTDS